MNNDSDLDQLGTLKQENEALHKQINELIKSSTELASYKIFNDSREKFLKWVALITLVLGMFGFVSLANIIETIRKQAAQQVTDTIVPQIAKDLQGDGGKELRKQVVEKISNEVRASVLKEASDQANKMLGDFKNNLEELTRQNQKLQDATSRLQTQVDTTIAQPKQPQLQQKVEEQKYLVIASSSTNKKELEDTSQGFKRKLGDKYKIRVCPPKTGNRQSAIVLGDLLSLTDAQSLVKMAKEDGWQSDTYPIRDSSAFFELGVMCGDF